MIKLTLKTLILSRLYRNAKICLNSILPESSLFYFARKYVNIHCHKEKVPYSHIFVQVPKAMKYHRHMQYVEGKGQLSKLRTPVTIISATFSRTSQIPLPKERSLCPEIYYGIKIFLNNTCHYRNLVLWS